MGRERVGNGVPIPLSPFSLKWAWSCFKMAIYWVRSHTFFVSATSLPLSNLLQTSAVASPIFWGGMYCILTQGWGALVKMTQLRLRSSSVHERGSGSRSGAVTFHEWDSGSRALFFHGSSSGFFSFSHINIFNCLFVPQVEWKIKNMKLAT